MLTSDEFNSSRLGPQWEWNHNSDDSAWSLTERKGFLRLKAMPAKGLLTAHNTLTECMQDEDLEVTIRLDLAGMKDGVHAGLSMFEKGASGLEIVQENGVRTLRLFHLNVPAGANTNEGTKLSANLLELRVAVRADRATYSYSEDEGSTFHPFGQEASLTFSWWKGTRPAIFSYTSASKPEGWVDVDWVHYRTGAEKQP